MKLGMYTEEIARPTIQALFDAVKAYGFEQVQFDFLSVCDEQMPEHIPAELTEKIRSEAEQHEIEIVAVTGTFNSIHPNTKARLEGIRRFRTIASACCSLNCNIVTLCTGSRSMESMWSWHHDNSTREAWKDLIKTMESLVTIAEESRIYLGIECEASNTVASPEKARRLLNDMKSSWLKIVMDAANLFQEGEAFPQNVHKVIKSAFDLLGPEIVLAHGKDILPGNGLIFTSAGKGIIDFDYFIKLLDSYGYEDAMILHGIHHEADFPTCVDFMRKRKGY